MKTINCLGYSIYSEDFLKEDFLSKKTVINTINPHCYCEAKKDDLYSMALHQSDILLPDGIGIVWAIKVLTKEIITRVAGSDLHIGLLERMNKNAGKVFYMGSSPETLLKIQERIKREYPAIVTGSYSPPYKAVFTDEDNAQILAAINEFQPDVLFIGMTAPKQEKWVHQHKEQLNAKIIASVGAVFDFYAGTVKRSGKFWISLGLEWLPRLLREPKRLWRRNFISTPSFILEVLKAKIKQ